jgi:hypothetical protein
MRIELDITDREKLEQFKQIASNCSVDDAVQNLVSMLFYTWSVNLPCGRLQRYHTGAPISGSAANYTAIIRREVEKFNNNRE